MPYIANNDSTKITKTDRRAKLKANPALCETAGDLNYVYTVAALKEWNKNPKYETIDKIWGSLVGDFDVLPEIMNVNFVLLDLKDDLELTKARNCAWMELYTRLFARYEEGAIDRNGDLEEFIEAFSKL